MALDKLVDSTQLDTDLTAVANAIRTKGGTSASLAFPADFVSAIAAISGGGGASFGTGTITPASASTTISFDTGLSTIHGILVSAIGNSFTGVRTQTAMISIPDAYHQSISIFTNTAGTGSISWSGSTTSTRYTTSGTTVTVTGQYNFQPIEYVWVAW